MATSETASKRCRADLHAEGRPSVQHLDQCVQSGHLAVVHTLHCDVHIAVDVPGVVEQIRELVPRRLVCIPIRMCSVHRRATSLSRAAHWMHRHSMASMHDRHG
jgi:hypothetical protein